MEPDDPGAASYGGATTESARLRWPVRRRGGPDYEPGEFESVAEADLLAAPPTPIVDEPATALRRALDELRDAIGRLAESEKVSEDEVLRRAIGTETFVQRLRAKGRPFYTRDDRGRLREIEFPGE